MRHALILAGGSGLRLWPLSRQTQPKQLIPFLDGRCLLAAAAERLGDTVATENRYICAAEQYREAIAAVLPGWSAENFIGEPVGRDTLMGIGLSAAVIAQRDPQAILAVFPADHLIQPVEEFRRTIKLAYALAEQHPDVLITFGIAPTTPSTAYGYLEIGAEFAGSGIHKVCRFREKPDANTAGEYFHAGCCKYLWNSGMFVWRAKTLLDCIRRYRPDTARSLDQIAQAWNTHSRDSVLQQVYAAAEKVSIDYAVMEPASHDPAISVLALPLTADWLDVGSWPAFGLTRRRDEAGNMIAAPRCVLQDSSGTLVVSDVPGHLLAVVGCDDLIVVHTRDATLVCRAEQAESIKRLHAIVATRFGGEYV
jgi:mannose-1-phosphate guanylyltransferase